MNLKNYLIGAGLSAIIIAGAAIKNGDQIKVSVVHYSHGETTVMDTIFDAESGYTAEQFLRDNGLDPEKAQIINTDAFDGKHILQNEGSVLFMRDTENSNHHSNEEIMIKQSRTVSVTSEGDEGREIIIEEIIGDDYDENEEIEVIAEQLQGEMEEIEVIVEQLQGEIENVFFYNMTTDSDNVKIENINGEITIELNGEELELEELLKNANLTNEQLELIQNGVNNSQGVGNENAVYEISTNGDHQAKVIVISNEMTEERTTEGDEISVRTIDLNMDRAMGLEHTIAIVSTVSGEEDARNSFIADQVDLPIEGPSYYPNPSEGKFRLEFFLPERGQTQIQLFDMIGRLVFDENLGNFQGAYNNNIDISSLESGHYIMHITQNNLRLAEKLIVN